MFDKCASQKVFEWCKCSNLIPSTSFCGEWHSEESGRIEIKRIKRNANLFYLQWSHDWEIVFWQNKRSHDEIMYEIAIKLQNHSHKHKRIHSLRIQLICCQLVHSHVNGFHWDLDTISSFDSNPQQNKQPSTPRRSFKNTKPNFYHLNRQTVINIHFHFQVDRSYVVNVRK